ncbi:MAG: AMP-binding protein [Magnetococcus sp. WYHC-3]
MMDAAPAPWPQCLAEALSQDRWLAPPEVPPEDVAVVDGADAPPQPWRGGVVLATSGTLGVPRRVRLTAASLECAARAAVAHCGFRAGELWVSALPLGRIGGLTPLLRAWSVRGRWAGVAPADTPGLWRLLTRDGASHVSLVPVQLARLLDLGPPPPSLRVVLVGGGRLSRELARRAMDLGWPVWSAYGLTEAGGTVSAGPLTLEDLAAPGPLPVGRALPGWRVSLAAGGEIHLDGAALCDGWDPETPCSRPYPTGDLGSWDARGRLVLCGRVDERLDCAGHGVDPAGVEGLLETCPGVRAALVTGVPDAVWGTRLGALVVGMVTPAEVLAWCGSFLPSPQRPRVVRVVADLPRTAAGKPDRAGAQALLFG